MNLAYDFTGQVALVTGAGSGMGLSTARAFAEAGAAVVSQLVLHAGPDPAQVDRGHPIERRGWLIGGVARRDLDTGVVERHIQSTEGTHAAVDHGRHLGLVRDVARDPQHAVTRNLQLIGGRAERVPVDVCEQMLEQGSGAIVNCSSLGGLVGLPGRAAYHASKHGVIGLTRSAALEYAARGVRINAICPGTIETPMVTDMVAKGELDLAEATKDAPIGRLGQGEEIAAAVLWLCSPGASFVVGVALPVDGGYTAR